MSARLLTRYAQDARAMTATGLGLMIATGWLALFSAHSEAGLALDTIEALCLQIGGSIGLSLFPSVVIMWLLMSVAMMLPTAMPTIDLYVQLSARMDNGRVQRILLFTLGYLVSWGLFGVLAASAQIALRALPLETVPAGLAGGAVLLIAGAYQFSALKNACLALCRNPMMFFMSRWRESLGGTLRMGLEHGIICIGCCWALMLLMFITGTMNLLWMAVLGLAMLAEKTLPRAEHMGRTAGGLMIAAGATTFCYALI